MRILGPLALAQTTLSGASFGGITALSSLAWALFYTTVGNGFGVLLGSFFGQLHRSEVIIIALAIAGLGLIPVLRRRLRTRRAARDLEKPEA